MAAREGGRILRRNQAVARIETNLIANLKWARIALRIRGEGLIYKGITGARRIAVDIPRRVRIGISQHAEVEFQP
ncbi:hypothetical protein BB029_12730 [Pseudomonas sp. S3E12]|nr:hypothetical protein BB029_12730 [Pseudomonas sp. S3E12]